MRVDYKKRDYEIDKKIEELKSIRDTLYSKKKGILLKHKNINEDELFNETVSKNNGSSIYYKFKHKVYKFVNFKNLKFGKYYALSESNYISVSGIEFYFVKFDHCIFNNIIFNDCHFYGCLFDSCMTSNGKLIFKKCHFRGSETNYINNNPIIQNTCTEFSNCMFSLSLKHCFADYLLFEKCKLIQSEFTSCQMPDSIFNKCGFYSVHFINSNIDKLSIKDIENHELEFHNIFDIWDVDNEIYISFEGIKNTKKIVKKKTYKEEIDYYKNLSKMYFTLSKLLSKNNINDNLTIEYTYLYNYFSMKSKKNFLDRFIFYISWTLCGFGDKMSRFLIWFIVFILSTSFAYMFSGLSLGGTGIIKYSISSILNTPINIVISDFLTCIHFSIVTFSTVGYGNITPYGSSYVVSAIQIIMGIVFVAIFTSVIVKKFLKTL